MKGLWIILLLCGSAHAYAQELAFDYSIGYGAYQLKNIKNWQHSMLHTYGMEDVDCFPAYITHTAALGFMTDPHHLGINFSYLTTGGRLHRADYSGSSAVDIIMNGYRIGAFYRHYIHTGSPLSIYLQFSPGVLFSHFKMKRQVNIYSESDHETTELEGAGMYLEPSVGATYRVADWLHFSLGGGYEADFWGTLKLSGQETILKAHWNGWRFYGGLIFMLPIKKTVHE